MSTRKTIGLAAVAAVVLGLAATAWLRRSGDQLPPEPSVELTFAPAAAGDLEREASRLLIDEPPDKAVQTDPAKLFDAANKTLESMDLAIWHVSELAAWLGKDPAAAFEFVRDAIAFDPYPGVLRGADGALVARAGNSWDRALLLKSLLTEEGLNARLAFGTLDAATATVVMKRAHDRPVSSLPGDHRPELNEYLVGSIAARARRDDAALRRALGARLNELGADDSAMVQQTIARHAWVQVQKDGAWLDLDPTLLDSKIGSTLTTVAETSADVPKDQIHTVILRVVTESVADGKLNEVVSLQHEMDAATSTNQHLLLTFVPMKTKPAGLLGGGSSSSTAFVPALLVNGEPHAGRPIEAGLPGGGGNFADALGGGGDAPANELVGLHIDVETRVPGRAATVARHVLLDRISPEARFGSSGAVNPWPSTESGDQPRLFRGFHHVLISTGGNNPYAMAQVRAWALDPATNADRTGQSLDGASYPLWVSDLALVEGSEGLIVRAMDAEAGGRTYVDEPRVYLTSWFPEPGSVTGLSRETDLLIDPVRFLASEPGRKTEIAARQIWYGALQSALETETALGVASAWDPAEREVFSTSLVMTSALTVLGQSDVARLPPGSVSALRAALARGDLVIVPGDMSKIPAWWTVARSGATRALGHLGAGMSGINPPGGPRRPPPPPKPPKPPTPPPPPPKKPGPDRFDPGPKKVTPPKRAAPPPVPSRGPKPGQRVPPPGPKRGAAPRPLKPPKTKPMPAAGSARTTGTEYLLVLGVGSIVTVAVVVFRDEILETISKSANEFFDSLSPPPPPPPPPPRPFPRLPTSSGPSRGGAAGSGS